MTRWRPPTPPDNAGRSPRMRQLLRDARTIQRPVTVTTDIPADHPHNHSGRDVHAGERLYQYVGPLYGVIDTRHGVALTERHGEPPAFEFPRHAIRPETRPDDTQEL